MKNIHKYEFNKFAWLPKIQLLGIYPKNNLKTNTKLNKSTS